MTSGRILVTSDTHFGHGNIIRYCGRPFGSTAEMNEEIIRRWNDVVMHNDVVYHLGDFCFGAAGYASSLLRRLSGRVTIVKGNHDRSCERMREIGFVCAHSTHVIEADVLGKNRRIFLKHCPALPREWDRGCNVHLCGHVHEKWRWDPNFRAVNVGVDAWDFRPITLEQAIGEWDRKFGG